VGGSQVCPRIDSPAPAAQPLAVQKLGAGEHEPHARPAEVIDRLPVELVGYVVAHEERTAQRQRAAHPVAAPCGGELTETRNRRRGVAEIADANGGLHILDGDRERRPQLGRLVLHPIFGGRRPAPASAAARRLCRARCVLDRRLQLPCELLSSCEVPGCVLHGHSLVQHRGQVTERTLRTGGPKRVACQLVPGLVVTERVGDPGGDGEPPEDVLARGKLLPQHPQRARERRGRHRISVQEELGQTGEEHIAPPRRRGHVAQLRRSSDVMGSAARERRNECVEVRLARRLRVGRFQLPGGGEEARRRPLQSASERQRLRLGVRVPRTRLRQRKHPAGSIGSTRELLAFGGGEGAPHPRRSEWSQLGGPLEERCDGRCPSASPRPCGRPLELVRHFLVRPRCGVGSMPCPPVGLVV
jgi:hypothetical protein